MSQKATEKAPDDSKHFFLFIIFSCLIYFLSHYCNILVWVKSDKGDELKTVVNLPLLIRHLKEECEQWLVSTSPQITETCDTKYTWEAGKVKIGLRLGSRTHNILDKTFSFHHAIYTHRSILWFLALKYIILN